ncbi:hypothetical protein EYC98_13940 [Halieaceae bacterium IMCC14734]|uniref:Copper oxidase n=1 Tax=Candidatus Litorirhabdus singularis TaxID=2518993 RepID=A0ABT3TKM4_9GAMM|nr:hypothetical protein [Candidatus Litorirhabdus singularis]MCX2981959.1 hypothetical protein [Candidatus Litorirhabdus singularis]
MAKIRTLALLWLLALAPTCALAQHAGHHNMQLDTAGMVMNANHDRLPRGCDAISRDYDFDIAAGQEFAAAVPGTSFGLSMHEVRVEPCARVTVNFSNRDEVRHQWMVHGLPKYLYPTGMFHLEANAGASVSGTFIVPGDDRTYLIHCDMAQHMEKGMKGQLVVGKGSGNLWSVPGVSRSFYRDSYLPRGSWLPLSAVFLMGIIVATLWVRRGR